MKIFEYKKFSNRYDADAYAYADKYNLPAITGMFRYTIYTIEIDYITCNHDMRTYHTESIMNFIKENEINYREIIGGSTRYDKIISYIKVKGYDDGRKLHEYIVNILHGGTNTGIENL